MSGKFDACDKLEKMLPDLKKNPKATDRFTTTIEAILELRQAHEEHFHKCKVPKDSYVFRDDFTATAMYGGKSSK